MGHMARVCLPWLIPKKILKNINILKKTSVDRGTPWRRRGGAAPRAAAQDTTLRGLVPRGGPWVCVMPSSYREWRIRGSLWKITDIRIPWIFPFRFTLLLSCVKPKFTLLNLDLQL